MARAMTPREIVIAKAICAERCAHMGEPPCHSIDEHFPPETCDDPGCAALAWCVSVALWGA